MKYLTFTSAPPFLEILDPPLIMFGKSKNTENFKLSILFYIIVTIFIACKSYLQ
jgi:hypothetical protein